MAEEKGKGADKKDDKAKGKDAEAEEPAEGEGEKKKKPLVFKIVLFSSLAILLIGVVIVVASRVASNQNDPYSHEDKPEKKEDEHKNKSILLETFDLGSKNASNFKLVISQGGEQHNVLCSIQLGYSAEYAKEKGEGSFSEELDKRKPQLREIVYRVLGSKKLEDLQYSNLTNIEEELELRMNEILEHGKIADIMFEEYIIQ